MQIQASLKIIRLVKFICSISIITLFMACDSSEEGETNIEPPIDIAALKIELGEAIFNDINLSEPGGQSCADCHNSQAGFADPDVTNIDPVSEGVVSGQFGNRNAPTAAYASFIPSFSLDTSENIYIGGLFVDGRSVDLVEQAKGPFLNELEMANIDEDMVIEKIRNASYAEIFRQVYGESSLNDVSSAYNNVADAIVAFESTELFAPFNSKFDAFLAGTTQLTEQETQGLDIFQNKGLCTECHIIQEGNQPLFTNHTYSNVGTPANPNNPFYLNNPDFIDFGLSENPNLTTDTSIEQGKFRVPTLRNIELTAPYMHNGVFQTLEDVVSFYNTRDSNRCYGASADPFVNCWPDPEVDINVDISSMGDLLLTEQEEADLVAFLKTLTDGFQ